MALLTACSEIPSKQSLEEKYVLSDSKFVELRGNRVHYTDEGQGETVILLHGTASSLHTWNPWAQTLKQQYRVVRLDLTGSGLTGPDVEDRYEVLDKQADQVLQKLHREGQESLTSKERRILEDYSRRMKQKHR